MKQEKVFVRFNQFDENPPPPPPRRHEKKPYQKKKYAEKSVKTREGFKHIFDSFEPINKLPKSVEQLLKNFPKFFTRQSKMPQKQNSELLNDALILHARKFFEGLKEPRKDAEQMLSQSDPDWNSDDDVDDNMESIVIKPQVVEKVSDDLKGRPINRPTKLKLHEIKFLEHVEKEKKIREQEEAKKTENSAEVKEESKTAPEAQSAEAQVESPKRENLSLNVNQQENVWSAYQERQLSTFVDMGFMTKVDDNDDMNVEVIENDDMFNEDSNKSDSSSSKRSHSSEEEDDIFGDEESTTTIKTKQEPTEAQIESEKKVTQGKVLMNEHIFSDIAESIGLMPARCNWIIRNEDLKYKVSTDYMDAYYRKEKMYEMLPQISLNHSQFVLNENVQTPEGLATLKDFNSRKTYHNQYKTKYNFKHPTHHKKK